jgi:glycosyltransferase involved in cell wall biosynthesis
MGVIDSVAGSSIGGADAAQMTAHLEPSVSPFPSRSPAEPTAANPRFSRLREALKQRWHWRATKHEHPRLTLVSQFFPPDFAATGQLLDDLSRRLAERGLQVQVFTGMPAYAFNSADAERLTFETNRCVRRSLASRLWPQRIRGRAVNGLIFCARVAIRLLRAARRGDLLLYTTEPPYLPIVGWLVHRLTGTPYIVLLYDLYPDVLVELKVLPANHPIVRLWRRLNALVLRDAAELIVLSEPMAERLRAHLPPSQPSLAAKLHVIPSWADPAEIEPRPRDNNWFVLRHHLQHSFTVLYSGNQGRCHDLVTLLGAALILRHETQIRFLFVGKGPQNGRLRQLVHDWNLPNCTFLPYQDLDALPFSLTAAHLAVVSLGIEAEGLVAPSKLYGHLAAGTPIAAITPAGSYLRQLVEQHHCGRWFANGDSPGLADWIRHLVAHPAEAAGLGRSARDLLLTSASPDLITHQYLDVIRPHLPQAKLEQLQA